MKNILIMTGSMNIGGIEKSLSELLQIISPQKYQVTLLLESNEGIYLNRLPSYIDVLSVPEIHQRLYTSRKQQLLGFIKHGQLFNAINMLYHSLCLTLTKNKCRYFNWQCSILPVIKNKYDIAIAYHNPFRFPGHYIINNVSADTKILWNHTDISYSLPNIHGFAELYSKYDYICNVSEATRQSFISIFPELSFKTGVFYNIINTNNILSGIHAIRIKPPRETVILLTVGRLSSEKGADRIPKIASLLKNKGLDFIWYVVGDGPLRSKIENLVSELRLEHSVLLTGSIDNPYPYMYICDIYVQVSWQEGFPMVIGEALTLKKPCIVTDVGGSKEYFLSPNSGIVVQSNNDNCIANEIALLLDNPDMRETIASNINLDIIENASLRFDLMLNHAIDHSTTKE